LGCSATAKKKKIYIYIYILFTSVWICAGCFIDYTVTKQQKKPCTMTLILVRCHSDLRDGERENFCQKESSLYTVRVLQGKRHTTKDRSSYRCVPPR